MKNRQSDFINIFNYLKFFFKKNLVLKVNKNWTFHKTSVLIPPISPSIPLVNIPLYIVCFELTVKRLIKMCIPKEYFSVNKIICYNSYEYQYRLELSLEFMDIWRIVSLFCDTKALVWVIILWENRVKGKVKTPVTFPYYRTVSTSNLDRKSFRYLKHRCTRLKTKFHL